MSATLPNAQSNAAPGLRATQRPRDRILSAACELFYRGGINPVSVDAIAEAALTNKMTLYRHFKSKDELILAYVKQLASEGDGVWQRITKAHPSDPELRLSAWISHVDDVLMNKFARGCPLANAAVELHAAHPGRAVIEAYKSRKRDHLVKLFRDVQFRDPDILADEVFLMFEGARVNIQCGGKVPASRVVRMLRAVLSTAPRKSRR